MADTQSTSGNRLGQAGLRATRQRLLVLETLAVLSEHEVVDEFAHRPGETCYRLCGEGHHHHLVCARCHGVAELEGCEVDEWLGKAAREHGFAPTGHTLEVTGLCAACQAA